ncbi:zincin-like metallopeptidase domain-containing protein [Alkalilimnicola ehrlichii]|uniref:zincin-like metallopeptidase domain-containing protein n=1 Tax=Alkalilimnicola ehrlichii TaxID=351052 RepID=UPI002162D959|nr:zincin-like metallopeptidase domain-containing protein [Alkalilimnicola ehrlichii]
MPDRHRFTKASAYYATAAHELTHWTGAEHRLNRRFGRRFGDQAYAFEELVAELGAAFLCAELGIYGEVENHASYLAGWLDVLRKDKRAIFHAAAKAGEAHRYLMSLYMQESLKAVA